MLVNAVETEDLLRRLAPQVLGAVVRRYSNFDLAEDATQEALLAASAQWPQEGLPGNPRAWLITVASRRLTDLLRTEQARRRREDTFARRALTEPGAPLAGDTSDTLTLLLLCCHPSLSAASQIALTLRAVGGLSTAEIARALLGSEQTVTRRITRAKQTIKDSGVPFALPAPSELEGRLNAVLRVLYLIFNEGYGPAWDWFSALGPIPGSTPTAASTPSAATSSRWPATPLPRLRRIKPQPERPPTSSKSATSISRSTACKPRRKETSDRPKEMAGR
jgi:RNA polymerase sigma factor (sigma-70 family)